MKLYNTLTRRIEDFKPLNGKKVSLFVCGPTTYDYSHIGHAKTYVQLDILARALKVLGYQVEYLQNITDIDDKIITRAKDNKEPWGVLSKRFESEYYKEMEIIGNTSVTKYARATDYIKDIISQVERLMDKGFAYSIDDGIYFEVSKFPEYGKLSGRQEVKENDAQTRIDQSEQKRGWNDFCLWKFSKPDEPIWDAPFGSGRPGWHIEDTAITEHFFGPQYDIHGGAVDLIFPHHEAELTQMESISGKAPFVSFWVHVGFLNISNAKMSKSAGNFYTIKHILAEGYDPMAIRMLMLQSHYRSWINFTWELLDAAQNRLKNWQALADLRWQAIENKEHTDWKQPQAFIKKNLSEDLNTPQAITAVDQLADKISDLSAASSKDFVEFLEFLDAVFGLELSQRKDITNEQKEIIQQREKARKAKDWTKSDELRVKLEQQKISINDTPHGPIWSRI